MLQDFILSCKFLHTRKGQKTKGRSPTGLYKNDHNRPTHMLRRSGIQPCTLRALNLLIDA